MFEPLPELCTHGDGFRVESIPAINRCRARESSCIYRLENGGIGRKPARLEIAMLRKLRD